MPSLEKKPCPKCGHTMFLRDGQSERCPECQTMVKADETPKGEVYPLRPERNYPKGGER